MSDCVKKCQELTRRQQRAITIILQAKNITEGSAEAGITRQTFYEWYRNNNFRMEFIKQRQEIIDLALHELKTSASEAVNVLRELLQAEGEVIRMRTALGILEHIGKYIEFEKLESRIEAVERRIENQRD